MRPRARCVLGDRGDVRRLRALRPLARLVLHARALGERLEAGAGDIRVVHEEVLRSLVGSDEAVPLRIVEPLDGSVSHKKTPPCDTHERARRRMAHTGLALDSSATVARK